VRKGKKSGTGRGELEGEGLERELSLITCQSY